MKEREHKREGKSQWERKGRESHPLGAFSQHPNLSYSITSIFSLSQWEDGVRERGEGGFQTQYCVIGRVKQLKLIRFLKIDGRLVTTRFFLIKKYKLLFFGFFQNNRKISLILHQEKKNLKILVKKATNFVPRKHLVRTFFFSFFLRNPGNLVTCSIGRLIPGNQFLFIYLFIYLWKGLLDDTLLSFSGWGEGKKQNSYTPKPNWGKIYCGVAYYYYE